MVFYDTVLKKIKYFTEQCDEISDFDISVKEYVEETYPTSGQIQIDYEDLFESIKELSSLGIEVTFFEFQSEQMISIEFYNISLKGIL